MMAEDPRQYGLVTSLSRPGGNVTGITSLTGELAGKRLNLLLELVPQATTIAYLSLPNALVSEELKRDMLAAGRALGREIIESVVRGLDFEAAFRTLIEQRAGALIVGSFSQFSTRGRYGRNTFAARTTRWSTSAMSYYFLSAD